MIRCVRDAGVAGSNPATPTNNIILGRLHLPGPGFWRHVSAPRFARRVRRFNGIMFRNIRRWAVLGATGGQLAPRSAFGGDFPAGTKIFPQGPSADPSGRTTPNGDYGDSALDFEGRITVHLIRRSGHAASSARKSVGSIKCTITVIRCHRNSRGAGQWSAVQVSRALERLPS